MRIVLSILLLLMMRFSFAQNNYNYNEIDWKVQFIDAPTPDSLAKLLTISYTNDLQKLRAIFSWIAQHISYNTFIVNSNRRNASSSYKPVPDDTAFEWKSATEMTAIKVLKKRTAVCDGYAKLFKTLCDYAHIPCEVITGYARGYMAGNDKFCTNHTWNAVMIDSAWQLLDVTWASGYINYANEFVQRTDENYFLTPPQQFILDHYPENIEWALMNEVPAMSEFKHMPFKSKSFVKYKISAYRPQKGIIDVAVGDTVMLQVNSKDAKKDKQISPDPFFDSTSFSRSPFSAFLSPSDSTGNTFTYTYVVAAAPVAWLNIIYNQDVILRYRLNVKKDVAMKLNKQ